MADRARRLGAFRSLALAMKSWRTAAVVLLSFSSGLPYGLVTASIQDWMRSVGVDIRVVGLFALTQAPWTFKVMWSPLMDRFVPPFWGRRRGWMAITQVALAVCSLALAAVGSKPDALWLVGMLALATAFASASQDIAINAYTVEVLHKDEQGAVVGAVIALYRVGMLVSGGLAISVASHVGWPAVNVLIALVYIPILIVTWRAPEPEERVIAPKTLREAVWHPFIGFLARHRALEMLGFVLLYKVSEQLTVSLMRPFLIDMGYSADQRGIALASIGMVASIAGAFAGGWATTLAGLGHSLWAFGVLQIFSNIGYYFIARWGQPDLTLMYGAIGFEMFASGLATGAFSVLLLRMTQKRFSATQYALFTSLFAVPRLLAGPITGFVANAIGWGPFFLSTLALGIPGLVMLQRFVPFGVREPVFLVEAVEPKPALSKASLVMRGFLGALVVGILALGSATMLAAVKAMRETKSALDLPGGLWQVLHPRTVPDWVQIVGIAAAALIGGLFVAAVAVARRGAVPPEEVG